MNTLNRNKIGHSFLDLGTDFSTEVIPRPLEQPELVCTDPFALNLLGLTPSDLKHKENIDRFSGATPLANKPSVAMVYAGHQFGGYSPQLGDGRGVLIGDIQTPLGTFDIHLKGAGKTPYSRFGDGYAVLRSSIREFLAGIAMRGLGIATSHSACVIRGEDSVVRETLEPAAMLTRIAKTHVRFGSFEYFFHTNQPENVKKLADYILNQYLPEAYTHPSPYDYLFEHSVTQTAKMIGLWQAVGFCHGVMNTDNMSILGETIDYGPFGFMEAFNPHHICNQSDHQGRYAFNRQPSIGHWNLQALALALSPLLDNSRTQHSLSLYESVFKQTYLNKMRLKFGLDNALPDDASLIQDALTCLYNNNLDYTLFFRQLTLFATKFKEQDNQAEQGFIASIRKAQHGSCAINREQLATWTSRYTLRIAQNKNTATNQKESMLANNPLYTLRNFFAQQAIEQAYLHRDYTHLNQLSQALSAPYTEQKSLNHLLALPPLASSNIKVSCSS